MSSRQIHIGQAVNKSKERDNTHQVNPSENRILWKLDAGAKPEPIMNSHDLQALSKYSGVLKRGLAEGKISYIVTGNAKPALVLVVDWMQRQSKNDNSVPFPILTFSKYIRVLDMANVLDVSILRQEIQSRVDEITSAQVPLADVVHTYKYYSQGSAARRLVVESIGNAIWERRLVACPLYLQLRARNEEYRKDIEAYLEKRGQEEWEKRQAHWEAKKKAWEEKNAVYTTYSHA